MGVRERESHPRRTSTTVEVGGVEVLNDPDFTGGGGLRLLGRVYGGEGPSDGPGVHSKRRRRYVGSGVLSYLT